MSISHNFRYQVWIMEKVSWKHYLINRYWIPMVKYAIKFVAVERVKCVKVCTSTFFVCLNKNTIHNSQNYLIAIEFQKWYYITIGKCMKVLTFIKRWNKHWRIKRTKRKMLCFNFDNNCKWIWLNKNNGQQFFCYLSNIWFLALTNV